MTATFRVGSELLRIDGDFVLEVKFRADICVIYNVVIDMPASNTPSFNVYQATFFSPIHTNGISRGIPCFVQGANRQASLCFGCAVSVWYGGQRYITRSVRTIYQYLKSSVGMSGIRGNIPTCMLDSNVLSRLQKAKGISNSCPAVSNVDERTRSTRARTDWISLFHSLL